MAAWGSPKERGSIRDYISRARRAQQKHEQKHSVQLEIPPVEDVLDMWLTGGALWASDEERMEHFRATTFELPPEDVIPIGSRAGSPSFGGLKSARNMYDRTEPIPDRPGWRIDNEGREWYSAAWLSISD